MLSSMKSKKIVFRHRFVQAEITIRKKFPLKTIEVNLCLELMMIVVHFSLSLRSSRPFDKLNREAKIKIRSQSRIWCRSKLNISWDKAKRNSFWFSIRDRKQQTRSTHRRSLIWSTWFERTGFGIIYFNQIWLKRNTKKSRFTSSTINANSIHIRKELIVEFSFPIGAMKFFRRTKVSNKRIHSMEIFYQYQLNSVERNQIARLSESIVLLIIDSDDKNY